MLFWAQEIEKSDLNTESRRVRPVKIREVELRMYVGCCETKDVGNGQRQNNTSWTRIDEIQRLGQERLELAGN